MAPLVIACLVIAMIIGFVPLIRRGREITRVEAQQHSKNMEIEAKSFFERIKENKTLPRLDSSLSLNTGESAILADRSTLMETRAERSTAGISSRVRVAKGVTIGGWSGSSQSTQEWRTLDTGDTTLTNQRLIFIGSIESRNIKLTNILDVKQDTDGIEIFLNKGRPLFLTLTNPIVWKEVIRMVKAFPDPFDLSNVNFDIS
ncbi:MAG TPA: hypothetical protein VIM11_09430 [Tepidisphaeraceae bacterium]